MVGAAGLEPASYPIWSRGSLPLEHAPAGGGDGKYTGQDLNLHASPCKDDSITELGHRCVDWRGRPDLNRCWMCFNRMLAFKASACRGHSCSKRAPIAGAGIRGELLYRARLRPHGFPVIGARRVGLEPTLGVFQPHTGVAIRPRDRLSTAACLGGAGDRVCTCDLASPTGS